MYAPSIAAVVVLQLTLSSAASMPQTGAVRKSPFKICVEDLKVILSPTACIQCDYLRNCTVLVGTLQVRSVSSHRPNDTSVWFPNLREVTGYVVVFAYRGVTLRTLFPNMVVIRGRSLFMSYALVVYFNVFLEYLELNSLSVVYGSVRIDSNPNLCYVNTIRWQSIVRDKGPGADSSSVDVEANNNICFTNCYKEMCSPASGHGSPLMKYCWGPGSSSHAQCQMFCDLRCGDSGCKVGTSHICCHPECLGGCHESNDPSRCLACKNLYIESEGRCGSVCPENQLVNKNLYCSTSCDRDHRNAEYFILNSTCLPDCPFGYIKDLRTNTCDQCTSSYCPKSCPSSVIRTVADSEPFEGCTIVRGNLILSLTKESETNTSVLERTLGNIQEIRGYLEVRDSAAIRSLKFLKKLQLVSPEKNKLHNYKYAIAILNNPVLEELVPNGGSITIYGGIFFHLNPRLCPNLITEYVSRIKKMVNESTDVSEVTNGYLVDCHMKKLAINITQPPKCFGSKWCIKVWWKRSMMDWRGDSDNNNNNNNNNQQSSFPGSSPSPPNLLFYVVRFRQIEDGDSKSVKNLLQCGLDENWQRSDVYSMPIDPRKKTPVRSDEYYAFLNVKPYTWYAIFVETYVFGKDVHRSDIVRHLTREAEPSPPLHPEVSFLSSKELLVKWKPPLQPNGVITKYRISHKKTEYSIWRSDINWCDREILSPSLFINSRDLRGSYEESSLDGRNITCDCKDIREGPGSSKDWKTSMFKERVVNTLLQTFFTKNDANITNEDLCVVPGTCGSIEYQKPAELRPEPNPQVPSASTQSPPTSTSLSYVEVNSSVLEYRLTNLEYFQEYDIIIIACTEAGCGTDYAFIRGRTDRNETADNLPGLISADVSESNHRFRIRWPVPQKPNNIVLRYDILLSSNDFQGMYCALGNLTSYEIPSAPSASSPVFYVQVRAITPSGNGSWSNKIKLAFDRDHLGTWAIALMASVVVVLVLLVTGILVFMAKRMKKPKKSHGVLYAAVNPEYLSFADVYQPDEWEVPRESIELIQELGQGSFGMVYEGIIHNVVPNRPKCPVAVKTVNEQASIRDRIDFLREASLMKSFDCNHVVRLIGVVSQGQPVFVVMELMGNGDLKNYLRKRRPEVTGALPTPTLAELIVMCVEVADGMGYLAAKKFVHRDLAARNCMVTSDVSVKIGDFGMTRDIYQSDYYRRGGQALLPVRWMAPESLKDGVFSTASDVWAYGVVLWEIATLASQPYYGHSNEEVVKMVTAGGHLERPEACPDLLYDLMLDCWRFNPNDRPSFMTIIDRLGPDLPGKFMEKSFYGQYIKDKEGTLLQLQTAGRQQPVNKAVVNLKDTPKNRAISIYDNDHTTSTVIDDEESSAKDWFLKFLPPSIDKSSRSSTMM